METQLHVFSDASEVAFGSVAYIRYKFEDNTFDTSLVMAKTKLAPIKTISLPRLELCGAVTAVRLYKAIIKDIRVEIDRVYFWTDSTITLQYIKNSEHRFKTFVANRVSEILDVTEKVQ